MRLPTKLSYQRSISPSMAVFFSVDTNGNQSPLEISTVKVLGQKDSASEGFSGGMELKKEVSHKRLAEGNPHTIDFCYAPANSTHLLCKFSCTVDASSLKPRVCNNEEVEKALVEFAQTYQKVGGFRYLSERYLKNILTGNWLWRNQNTRDTTIELNTSGGHSININGINRKQFEPEWNKSVMHWDDVVNEFENALCSPQKYMFCEVTAKLTVPIAHEIYPSQAFVEKGSKLDKSRTYQETYVEQKRTAIMGAYKVGAAIASIDDWYENADLAVRVGSFAVDKQKDTVYRHPVTKKDLFSLLNIIEEITGNLRSGFGKSTDYLVNSKDAHFIAANLIKGGLFGVGAK